VLSVLYINVISSPGKILSGETSNFPLKSGSFEQDINKNKTDETAIAALNILTPFIFKNALK
jgi:hypothetical protein